MDGDRDWGDTGEALVWYNMGLALSYLEEYQEAREAYTQAVKLQPNDFKSWNNLGVVLVRLERLEEGLEAYERALNLNPNDEIARNNANYLRSRLGQ